MEFLTGFGLALLVIIIVIVARDFGQLRVAKIFVMLMIASAGFLVHPLVPAGWNMITLDLEIMVPALFWLLCQYAFTDHPRLKSFWSVLAVYSFLVPWIARLVYEPHTAPEMLKFFGWTLGESFEYLLILNGLWLIVSNWSDDLVESRRKLRVAMLIIVGGAVSTAVISLNFGLAGEYTRGIIVSVSAFTIIYFLMAGKKGVLFGESVAVQDSITEEALAFNVHQSPEQLVSTEKSLELLGPVGNESSLKKGLDESLRDPDAVKLTELMEGGFYRTENLTLKMLAREIRLPEYRVRGLINQTLGYRNFNDYINQMRISEAVRHLIEKPEEPVLNISLDIGYRSISSFNRAFKDILGMSPTLYRQQYFSDDD